MALWLDHVVMATSDADLASARIRDDLGLDSIRGTSMHALGMKSLYVPLGRSFIEIIGIADEQLATSTPEGRFVIAAVASERTWVGWCIATDDLDPIIARTGCAPVRGFTAEDGGAEHGWRTACTHVSMTDPGLPFFLEWVHDDRYPGLPTPRHRVEEACIELVEVSVDAERLRTWVGDPLPWVRITDGAPGVRAVHVLTDEGRAVLR